MIVLLIVFVAVVGAIIFFTSRKSAPPSQSQPRGAEERLLEIDELRAKGVISDAEHAAKRKSIVDRL